MAEPTVNYVVKDRVATITLNRPDVLNAIDLTLSAELAEAAEAAAKDDAVWVVAVRGAGRAFSSGMDRRALSAGGIGEPFYRNWVRALDVLEDMGKLSVGGLHGLLGGRGGQPCLGREARGPLLPAAGGRRTLMADDFILETEGLTKEFRGFVAVKDVRLRVRRGTIHALIGPNGAGKTTCFNLLTHFLVPTRGRITFNGRDITGRRPADIARLGLVRSFQISAVFPHLTALENVRIALH